MHIFCRRAKFWHSEIHLSTLTTGFSAGSFNMRSGKYLGLNWGVLVGTVEFVLILYSRIHVTVDFDMQ